MNKKIFSWVFIIAFLIAISLPIILPYLHSGYFPTHDGEWAVIRLGDMFRTLRDFQIPPRYSGNLNFGYGYPLFNFTYPFPYYLGIFVHFLGAGFVNSIKILFAGSVFLSAFFMFLASKALWKNTWAGIISAIFYIYFPYRMVDLFVRGSIGESLSFALFPLLFYLLLRLINKASVFSVLGISICIGILVMTHNIMTVLFLPLYIIFSLIQIFLKNKRILKSFIISIVLGFGLSAFFWMPALFEKNNILLSQTPIANRNLYFVDFDQLLFSSWGYGVPTGENSFTYQLGVAHFAIFMITLAYLFLMFIKSKDLIRKFDIKSALVLAIISALYIFLLFKSSRFLWENLPLLSEINYPWINLGVLGFIISLLTGFLSIQNHIKYFTVFVAVFAIFFVSPYARPEYYINKGDDYYLTNDATTTSSNELMPLWVKQKPVERFVEKVEIIDGIGLVNNLVYNSKKIVFHVDAKDNIKVRINTIYYPGWQIYVDNINTSISYSNEHGVMDISVPLGSHIIEAKFEETPLRLTSDIISLSSVFMLFFIGLKRKKYVFS